MKSSSVHILTAKNTLLNQFIAEIRDAEVQKDQMRFRRNLERIGEIFAYEISKEFPYSEKEVTTSLGIANVHVPDSTPVIATILRAGLPFHAGMLHYFDRSDNAFISAFRKHHKDGSFSLNIEYSSIPEIDNKILILCDTMAATGSSLILAYKELLTKGKPSHIHVATVLASMEGLNYLKLHLPNTADLWVGVVDEELTAQSYIVPGLGDAGDLAFGKKI